MFTYSDVMNSGLLYVLVAVALLLVTGICVIFFRKARAKAFECGVTKEEMKAIYKNTIVLTILPSLTIVVGLFSLSAVIGVPWSWFRLSVIGSVVYELMAAEIAASALGFAELTAAFSSPASIFAAVMFVMSVGMCFGIVVNAVVSKPLSVGLRKASSKGGAFSPVMNACFSIALFGVLITFYAANSMINLLVMITAAAASQLMVCIAKKTGATWLLDLNLSLCLLIGMASSVLWTNLLT